MLKKNKALRALGDFGVSNFRDQVVIYIESIRAMKKLPPGQGIRANEESLKLLKEKFGDRNVTIR